MKILAVSAFLYVFGYGIFGDLNKILGRGPVVQSSRLAQEILVEDVMGHLAQLERIAFSHPNHSRSVLNAYNQSAEYVMGLLQEKTDCLMSIQPFRVPVWTEGATPKMALQAPLELTFQYGVDFKLMRYGGSAASLTAARLSPIANGGCSKSDFASVAGRVHLIDADLAISNCSLWDSAYNSQNSGALAVVFYNSLKRSSLMTNRVRTVHWKDNDPLMSIPVVSVSHFVGAVLLNSPSSVKLSLESFSTMEIADTFNIICDTREGDPDNVVMIGAHLDSVPEGPGLVDNASGTSSILAVFLKMYELQLNTGLVNKLRFTWWGAEELGLMGSRHYCRELEKTPEELKKIVVYSNHDMLGSPNYVPMIYRGGSAPEKLKTGSIHLQELYETYFRSLPPVSKFANNFELAEMSGGSDFYSFLEIGLPSGGLATGAGTIKTEEERHKFGGIANAAFDPCYHQSCDTLENINPEVLEVMAKSVGFVVESLGMKENIREWIQSE